MTSAPLTLDGRPGRNSICRDRDHRDELRVAVFGEAEGRILRLEVGSIAALYVVGTCGSNLPTKHLGSGSTVVYGVAIIVSPL